MSATSIFISSPSPKNYLSPFSVNRRRRRSSRDGGGGGGGVFLFVEDLHQAVFSFRSSSSIAQIFLINKYPYSHSSHKAHNHKSTSSTPIFTPLFKPSFPTVMKWQDCRVKMDIEVPISVAYNCYSDREAIARWMPFISSVKILEDKPDLSRWPLKYKAFGHDIEFSWLARNMQPIPNQKIHWRSLEGLPNRGAVRFFPKGPSSCIVELLHPFNESLLVRGLERFAKFAESYHTDSKR